MSHVVEHFPCQKKPLNLFFMINRYADKSYEIDMSTSGKALHSFDHFIYLPLLPHT
jgi:hypothetical protein